MFRAALFSIILPVMALSATSWNTTEPFDQWTLEKAVEVLNESPWARQETFTRVIRGVGSGISGEKEIYNTFYVRFLSARPIREAYARVQQIQYGYDEMLPEERKVFETIQQKNLNIDISKYIVVSISFRSNDPNEESDVRRFFQSETVETLKTKIFLSTSTHPQVELSAYFPQQEESIGAKFVFPREVNGTPVVTSDCSRITLEFLDVPGADSRLNISFNIDPMTIGDRIIL
ncbi:MAG: hypothetical protein P8Z37_08675 [Acidobacteriota bacterium]